MYEDIELNLQWFQQISLDPTDDRSGCPLPRVVFLSGQGLLRDKKRLGERFYRVQTSTLQFNGRFFGHSQSTDTFPISISETRETAGLPMATRCRRLRSPCRRASAPP